MSRELTRRRLGVRVQVTQLAVRIEAAQLQMAGAQHRLGGRDGQLGRGRPVSGLAAGEDADSRPEQLEGPLVLSRDELLLADHEALVTTPEAEPPDWSWRRIRRTDPERWIPRSAYRLESCPVVCALLVPAPSAGSCPFAI